MATNKSGSRKPAAKPIAALHAPVEAIIAAQPEGGAAAPAVPSVGDAAMNFSAQQLTVPEAPVPPVSPAEPAAPADVPATPAALPASVDINSPEFQAALAAALANRAPAASKAKVAATPRAKRVEQNGIKRPLAGPGICATMWATFDSITAEQGTPCTIAQAKAKMPDYNVVNMQGEYASWRKFNGIVGRIVAPVVAAPAGEVLPGAVTVDPVALIKGAEQEGTVADLGDSNVL